MKKIKLTKGKFALVDDKDFARLNVFNWYAAESKGAFYAMRKVLLKDGIWKAVKMHHVILGSPKDGMQADHADGDSLNNQRKNLRWSTPSQNRLNRGVFKNSSTGLKGIGLIVRSGKWQARVQINNKRVSLGHFVKKEDARRAHASYVKKHVGEFARLV